jgi:predicted amidohydrolase YtcJ
MDPAGPRAQAMGIVGGRIVCIGTESEVRSTLPAAARISRSGSGAILPGFIDSHNHMLATGLQQYLVDLSACRRISDVLDAVRDYAVRNPERTWIVAGQGWHIDSIEEQRYPTRWELDGVCADRPVYLPRIYHAAACNSRALSIAGIEQGTAEPAGGRIVRDELDRPTGELHEAPAMRFVERLVPPLTRQERLGALRQIQQRYLEAGICGVIDPGLSSDDISLYEDLWRSGELKIRTVAMPLAQTGEDVGRTLRRFGDWPMRSGFGDARFKIGGIKVFLDGGASLGTALLRAPYADRRCGCGIQVTTTEAFRQIVEFCAANGWSLGVHTVGGRAIDIALETFADVADRFDLRKLRFSIIHAYLWPSSDNIESARKLGVAIATQPSMQYQFAPVLLKRGFSHESIARATPLRSWLDGGVIVAGGSDAPATPYQPMLGIWHAVTRHIDSLNGALGTEQAISAQEALELYTRNAAWLSFSEHERGMLKPGMEADWIALSIDPLRADATALRNAKVHATAIGGEVLHEDCT